MRIVLDTNVILSAFLWQQQLRPIYLAVKGRAITPCFTRQTWDELQRALGYNKLKNQLVRQGIEPDVVLQLVASRSYFTVTEQQLNVIPDDPADNDILVCARTVRALYIVTGDRHLLRLNQFHGIDILTPRAFLQHLGPHASLKSSGV